MSSVSQILRQTREAKGITLEEVAQRTYIKLPYLSALEEGEIDKLPAPVYIHGYIRQYAKLLGLNGSELVLQYQQDLSRPVSAPKLDLAQAAPTLSAPAVQPEPVSEEVEPVEPEPRPRSIMPPDLRETSLNRRSEPPFEPAAVEAPALGESSDQRPAFLMPDIAARRLEPTAPKVAAMAQAAPTAAPVAPVVTPVAPVVAEPPAEISARRVEPPVTVAELQQAKQQAQQIIQSAQREAHELRIAAERYADQVLAQLESEVNRSLQTVRNGRAFLQSRRRRLQET